MKKPHRNGGKEMFKLLPAQDKDSLFFRMEGERAERHGFIGYFRADFGKSGREFWTTWFDGQPDLKTFGFKNEFDSVIDALRNDGQKTALLQPRGIGIILRRQSRQGSRYLR
jgi:hypothetical protein